MANDRANAEPLWRGKTEEHTDPSCGSTVYPGELDAPIGTEVEVWPTNNECAVCGGTGWSGDDPDNPERCACRGGGVRTPTREQIRELIGRMCPEVHQSAKDIYVDTWADQWWELLHGQGDETDGR